MAVGIVASASSGSQASVATFNISASLGTGARAGIVFVCIHNSATDIITGVTWNSVAMTELYKATDTDTEPGVVKAYFLNNVTNGAVTVSRTNNTVVTVGYAASISADKDCEAYQTITRVSSTQNTNANTSTTGTGASGEVSVDDGSPGTSSMRFAAAFSGAATPPAQGTNSTNLQVLDSTAYGSRFVRETTAGQGSRSVGFATGTTDDWALVAVAVRELPPILVQPGAAAVTIDTSTPTIVAQDYKLIQPAAAAISIAGGTPAVGTPTAVAPSAAAITIGTATPAIVAQNWPKAEPAAAAIGITTATPAIVAQNYILVQPAAAAIAIGTATPAIGTPVNVAPTASAITIAGATPAVALPIALAPAAASVGIAGATPAVAAHILIQPTAGAVAIAGATPAVSAVADVTIQPGAASVTIGTATPNVLAENYQSIQPAAAVMAMSGATPAIVAQDYRLIQPSPAEVGIAGDTPIVTLVSGGATIQPGPASIVFAMGTPTVTSGTTEGGRGPKRRKPEPFVPFDDDDVLALFL